jgi:hypothetical protein
LETTATSRRSRRARAIPGGASPEDGRGDRGPRSRTEAFQRSSVAARTASCTPIARASSSTDPARLRIPSSTSFRLSSLHS